MHTKQSIHWPTHPSNCALNNSLISSLICMLNPLADCSFIQLITYLFTYSYFIYPFIYSHMHLLQLWNSSFIAYPCKTQRTLKWVRHALEYLKAFFLKNQRIQLCNMERSGSIKNSHSRRCIDKFKKNMNWKVGKQGKHSFQAMKTGEQV